MKVVDIGQVIYKQGVTAIYYSVTHLVQEHLAEQQCMGKQFDMIVVHSSVHKNIVDFCNNVIKGSSTGKNTKMFDILFIGTDNIDKYKIYLV